MPPTPHPAYSAWPRRKWSYPLWTHWAALGSVVLAAATFAGCWGGPATPPKTRVVIGFTPAENADTITTSGEHLARLIAERTGWDVKVYVPASYTATVEAMRHRQVDFAWLTPFVLIQAADLCDARPLLKIERNGSGSYRSALVVRADSPIRTLADLKGKNAAWVDVSSNSGHIFPKMAFWQADLEPDTFLGRQIFAGGHDKVVLAVQSRQVEVGGTWCYDDTCSKGSWHRFLKDKASEIRPLWVSPALPNDTFAVSGAVAKERPEVVARIVAVLQEVVKTPEGGALLKELYGIEGLVPTSMAEFDLVRQAARRVELWKK